MIGLQGDAKNPGQLVANMDKAPATEGMPRNPRQGLIYATKAMFEAVERKDMEMFSNALESYISMYLDLKEMDKDDEKVGNGYSHEVRGYGNNDNGGWK